MVLVPSTLPDEHGYKNAVVSLVGLMAVSFNKHFLRVPYPIVSVLTLSFSMHKIVVIGYSESYVIDHESDFIHKNTRKIRIKR